MTLFEIQRKILEIKSILGTRSGHSIDLAQIQLEKLANEVEGEASRREDFEKYVIERMKNLQGGR